MDSSFVVLILFFIIGMPLFLLAWKAGRESPQSKAFIFSVIVRRMLLEILTSIYEKHASPKQLVEKHRLKPVLANIKEHDPVVIPREIARNLYSSFQIHDIL